MVSHLLPLEDPGAAARWEALRVQSGASDPFTAPAFVRAVAQATGREAHVLLLTDAGTDEAGVPVYRHRRGPFRMARVPPLVAYTPIVWRRRPDEAALHTRTSPFEALLAALENRFDAVALHLPPDCSDVRPARWRGWRTTPLYTYRLTLQAAEDPTGTWSASARRTFRRFQDTYDLDPDTPDPQPLLDLLAASFERQGRSLPAPAPLLAGLVATLQTAGLVRTYLLRRRIDGTPEAALALLHEGSTACYWLAGSRPGPAMTVLLGLLWRLLPREGPTNFDFYGANTPSIAEFKRRFGPRLTSYFRIEIVPSVPLRLYYWLRGV